MKVISVSQTTDRESWLELRKGVVTGTKAKQVAPLKRGTSLPSGIYELVAEKIAISKDGEPERDRGLRLENEALELTNKKFNLNLNYDPGMWFSDDMKLAVSPDASENIELPTYAAEAKCLDTRNHLMAIIQDWTNKKLPDYNPLDSLKFGKNDFTAQLTQYFVINPHLETVYFTFYDDRIAIDNIVHYVIKIDRKHVEEYIDGQEAYERDAIKRVSEIIKTLKEIK